MKKILFFALTAFLAASCLDDAGYEANYTLVANFDGAEKMIEEYGDPADSTVAIPMFAFGPVGFYNSIEAEEDGTVITDGKEGGWHISQKRFPADALFDGNGDEIAEQIEKLTPYSVADTAGKTTTVNSYLVFHKTEDMPEHDVEFLQSAYGTCSPSYVYLNNTTAVARYFMTKGKAQEGDYLKVKVTGYMGGQETSSKEFLLAEKTMDPSKDSLMLGWRALDISTLGSVQYVDFDIDAKFASAGPDEDLNWFCVDNFIASVHIKQ